MWLVGLCTLTRPAKLINDPSNIFRSFSFESPQTIVFFQKIVVERASAAPTTSTPRPRRPRRVWVNWDRKICHFCSFLMFFFSTGIHLGHLVVQGILPGAEWLFAAFSRSLKRPPQKSFLRRSFLIWHFRSRARISFSWMRRMRNIRTSFSCCLCRQRRSKRSCRSIADV